MNTTDMGRLGESKAIARLVELGWYPFTDISGKCPVDLVAWKDGTTKTFQVKSTAKLSTSGSYVASIGAVRPNRTKAVIHRFDPLSCDYLAIYVQPTDAVYFIPTSLVTTGREIHVSAKHAVYLTL